MIKYIIPLFFLFAFFFDATAAIKVNNNNVPSNFSAKNDAVRVVEEMKDPEEEKAIAELEAEIRAIDEEINKCEKQKKGWIAATVIGGAGVLSTGVAATVQGVKIKEQKEVLDVKNKELESLNKEKDAL